MRRYLTVANQALGETQTTGTRLEVEDAEGGGNQGIGSNSTHDTLVGRLPDTGRTRGGRGPATGASTCLGDGVGTILSQELNGTEGTARRHNGDTHVTEENQGSGITGCIKATDGTRVGGGEVSSGRTRHIGGGASGGILIEHAQVQAHILAKRDEILTINWDLLEVGTDGRHFIFSLEKKNWAGTEE